MLNYTRYLYIYVNESKFRNEKEVSLGKKKKKINRKKY